MPVNTQVVVITGAGSGVGRETARLLARTGARLVLAGRRMETLQDAAELCRLAGTSAVPLVADTADPAAVQAVADAAVAEFGRIDVWVNNASLASYSRFEDLPLEDFRRVMDVNVMGYVYGCRAALAQMEKQGTGLIINVASIVGEVPQPYTAPYSMSKAAVRALGVSLRSELALHGPHGIRISTVLPPTIDTPFFDHAANYTGRRVRALPPVYPARIVAKHILRLVRRPRPERVPGIPGRLMVLQHRLTPRLVEAFMARQVEYTNLSRKQDAPDGPGNLYRPAPAAETGGVSGGWHGKAKHAARIVLAGTAAAGVVLLRRRANR